MYKRQLALLAGRRTFSLRWIGGRYELDRRDHWRIAGSPAGLTNGTDILVEHDCQLSVDNSLPTADTRIRDMAIRMTTDQPLPELPPF